MKSQTLIIDENTSDGYHTFKELYEYRLYIMLECLMNYTGEDFM